MKTRAFVIALSATVLLLGAGSAFAYGGHGGGHGGGYGMMGGGAGMMGGGAGMMGGGMGMNCPGFGAGGAALTAEQQQAYAGTMKDFEARILPLQEKAMAKRMELDALSRNTNAKPETITALVRELTDINSQMNKEQLALRDQMTKSGIAGGYGMRGAMMGDMGSYHNGGGHRGGRGGHGGGCSW